MITILSEILKDKSEFTAASVGSNPRMALAKTENKSARITHRLAKKLHRFTAEAIAAALLYLAAINIRL